MINNVFKIRNLKCKYASNVKPVLEIDSLDIEDGSSTFFIGPSGVGKSTVLETLGLMNNTVFQPKKNNTIFEFRVNDSDDVSMLKLWNLKESEIADFRNRHLSFIFQNTNLFNTLSAYDNIAITSILQGKNKKQADKKTKTVVSKILDDVTADKPINELSGGQRQRIAFARAIVTDYTVLFADEPTGNLDKGNAKRLMQILHNETDRKTKIIVTHDINLTLEFATQIVLIDRVKRDSLDDFFGHVNSETIFKKNNEDEKWYNSSNSFSNTELLEILDNKLYKKI